MLEMHCTCLKTLDGSSETTFHFFMQSKVDENLKEDLGLKTALYSGYLCLMSFVWLHETFEGEKRKQPDYDSLH